MICYEAYKTPRQYGDVLSGRGDDWRLAEADAGYVGGFDIVGCVIVLFRECDGEVLDLVFDAEFHQEFDEVSEVLDEVVIVFVCFDLAQEDYVVGEIGQGFGPRQNDKCGGKCRMHGEVQPGYKNGHKNSHKLSESSGKGNKKAHHEVRYTNGL